jgi:hypothetical protein
MNDRRDQRHAAKELHLRQLFHRYPQAANRSDDAGRAGGVDGAGLDDGETQVQRVAKRRAA